ncbi:MAG: insulinase family protein [Gemmatimonadetes bacterium]|nr:insulinase family protein [Gemmatimonadota bacterium]
MNRRMVIAVATLLYAYPAIRLSAQESFPTKPPASTALSPVRFPPFQEVTLSNGVRLVVIENHEQPTVSVALSFRAGATADPAGKEGLSALVAELITKGTPTRTAEQIAATIEGVGGSLAAGSSQDLFTLRASALTDHVDLVVALLADVTRNATFRPEELELARTRYLSALQVNLSDPEFLAERFFDREIYGAHLYGRMTSPESYKAISRDDVVKFAATRLRPSGALMVVAGDITLAQARALAARHFAGWSGTPAPVAPAAAAPVKGATDILLVHRPGSVQSNIVVGNTTMLPRDTNYFAARVVTHVLGGGSDSRLFQIIREQKSWTYDAHTALNRFHELGNWQAVTQVRTAVTDSALNELLHQVDRIRTEAIPDSELVGAKGFLVGVFPLTIETPQQIAQQVATVKLLGLPANYLHTYRERLGAVTARRALAAARQTYRRHALTIVVVGDATQLYEKLTAVAPVRLVDADGKPLTPDDLVPKAGPLVLDRGQLVTHTDSFQVVIQGNPMGAQVSSLRQTADSLIYSEQLSIPPFVTQHTTVVFDPRDISVRQVDQTGSVQGQPSEIHLRYGGNRVQGTAKVPQPTGAPRELTIDTTVAPGTYDDNALATIVPALPLEPGKTFPIGVLTSGDGSTRVFTVKVGDVQGVTVPAGTFQAYRIDVSGGQAPFVFYVSTTTPRRLVKIEVLGAPFVFELVK